MRMEMTMATMDRLTKNRDIRLGGGRPGLGGGLRPPSEPPPESDCAGKARARSGTPNGWQAGHAACCAISGPASAGQRDEWVTAEAVVDHPFHLVHGGLRLAFEPERQIGVRVRRAHESPSCAEEDPCAVCLDRLVLILERAGELSHHPELLVVGTRRLQLGRVVKVG